MSEMLKIMIVDASTGSIEERDFSSEEMADYEAMQAEIKKNEAEAKAKTDARESGLAKLAALGFTQDEIEALA